MGLPTTLQRGDMLGKTAEGRNSYVCYLDGEARDIQPPKRQLRSDTFSHRATPPGDYLQFYCCRRVGAEKETA